jgi:hypothetical protein
MDPTITKASTGKEKLVAVCEESQSTLRGPNNLDGIPGTRTPGHRSPGPWSKGFFLFYFFNFFGGSSFFHQKMKKNIVFSLFFLSFSLSLYTHFGLNRPRFLTVQAEILVKMQCDKRTLLQKRMYRKNATSSWLEGIQTTPWICVEKTMLMQSANDSTRDRLC